MDWPRTWSCRRGLPDQRGSGVIEAQGCLQRVATTKDLPRGEQILTDQLIADFRSTRKPSSGSSPSAWLVIRIRIAAKKRSTDWRDAAVSATEVYYSTQARPHQRHHVQPRRALP